jgi:uncharacterized protein YfaP (DUF2135 family)
VSPRHGALLRRTSSGAVGSSFTVEGGVTMARLSVWTMCAGLALAGCSGDDPAGPGETMEELIPSVAVGGAQGVFVNERFPQAADDAPAPTVRGSAQIVRGGSVIVQVTTPGPASALLVRLADPVSNGYYVIDLAAATASAPHLAADRPATARVSKRARGALLSLGTTAAVLAVEGNTYALVITSAASLSSQSLRFEVATRNGGTVSAPAMLDVGVNPDAEASEQLQVSLNWNAPVDMDLHVQTPNGQDIFYGNLVGSGGGALDLDSNAGCDIDGIDNENITWGEQEPEEGRYIVRVDLWSACEHGATIPFTVTTNMCGRTSVYESAFSPAEENFGGAYSGRVVQVFERTPRIEKLEMWVNAFIPRHIEGYTLNAPSPYDGQTLVPSPFEIVDDKCYFTDQRSFSSDLNAGYRMQSYVELDFSGNAGRVASERHTVGPTREISCSNGSDIGGVRTASNSRMDYSALRKSGNRYTIDVKGATGNPHVLGAPDADYEGTLTIDFDARQVLFSGKVDDFPAYEAYLRVNGGEPITLFTRFDPASRATDLFGSAVHPVVGEVQLPCLRRA